MLTIPLVPDLRFGYKPVLTFGIILLCLTVHYFQDKSRVAVRDAARAYCLGIDRPSRAGQPADWLASDPKGCERILQTVHALGDRELLTRLLEERYAEEPGATAPEQFDQELTLFWQHYDRFLLTAPSSLDARLIYYPTSPNPIRMLTSNFAHADWQHVIGNMIFYFAFAVALEMLIGNAIRYLAIIVTLAVVSCVADSITRLFSGVPLATLGFSGVVMGMIGLSAYLMPRARIRAFVWLFFWAQSVFIPAWIFAAWYIGWDTYYLLTQGNNGGIDFVAHVACGFTGYLLGWWWLRDHKWLIEEDLADEIDYMRARRHDRFGILRSHINKRAFRETAAAEQERQRSALFEGFVRRLYQLITSGQYSAATVLLLEELPAHGELEQVLKTVFERVRKWPLTQFTLCLGRYYVGHLTEQGRQKEALNVCDWCYQLVPEFVLAQPLDVLPLALAAERQHRHSLAYALVRDAKRRYGQHLDLTSAGLMEARLLAHHLQQPSAAGQILEGLLRETRDANRKAELLAATRAIATLSDS